MPSSAAVVPSGLLRVPHRREAPAPVPLEGVKVEARIRDFCARVSVAHRYRNVEDKPLEAVYVFPLDEGAAVCGFEAVIGETRVVGRAKEREEAFAAYDDALAAGHGAYLLDQERPDVFTASIGNLPPGKEVLVRISYVAELAREGDDIRFALPTTVSPRYAPAEDRRGVGRAPAEAVNPPVDWTVPYGLELAIEVEMASAIRSVESPSHPLAVEMDGSRASVRLGERRTALDRDFVLKVRLAEPHAPRAWVETDASGKTVALLAFEPRFETGEAPGELVFLLDRSGSMGGTSIDEARSALQLCLRSLRPGTFFNVVGFGSSFEPLFPESRPYGEDTLAEASRRVAALEADMGGTEILPALEWILTRPARPGLPRQLFVLTDGQVSNTEAVVALVRKHSVETRVFTFGIGAGASAHLVRGIARAGEGEAEFIAPGERIEEKVMRQLKRALAPALTQVEVDWGGQRVTQAPHRLPPVFAGGRVLAYGWLEELRAAEATLRARGPDGPVELAVRFDPATAVRDTLLSTLAARTTIRDLEEGRSGLHDRRGSLQERTGPDRVKKEIVRLAVEYGLASRETSFVAVEERETPAEGDAVLRRVPVALTRGWGGFEDARLRAPGGPLAAAALLPTGQPARLSAYPIMQDSMTEELELSLDAAEERPAMMESGRDRGGRPLPPSRPLDRLVALQRADGSWDLTRELAEVLGRPLWELEVGLAGATGDPAEARRAWATALALLWLETAAAGDHDRWELLAEKAEAWLAGRATRPASGRDWRLAAREFGLSG